MEEELNSGLGRQMPPRIDYVKIYFIQKGLSETERIFFFNYFEQCKWKDQNNHEIKNWKTLACEWIWEIQHFKIKG